MIRGINPIWTEFDLTGNLFDDSFYMFALENEIPYAPAAIYQDQDGNVPRANPVNFEANGTLPIDVYFDPDIVYRLEFREGPTQSDPLIYLVENYIPGSGGSTPISSAALTTDNQITNAQFSLINFSSPMTLTNVTDPDPIEIAPGWTLNLAGTGSVTLTQVPLNNSTSNPTNAGYALQIQLTGTWSDFPYLSQRFNQNGMLWAEKYVSSSVTAKILADTATLSGRIDDSDGNELVEVLPEVSISTNFEEYLGYGLMPATLNPDLPPDAWIEFKLFLPNSVNILITSIQLVATEIPLTITYQQDTNERQVDHTFHYYRESLLRQPKESILTGWDFPLNPWQFYNPVAANVPVNQYTADQTIIVQQAYVASASGNNISVGRSSSSTNFGFLVTSVTANNQFAMIQYIDPKTMRPYWGSTLSAMVKLHAEKQDPDANLRMKARLLYRSSLPSTIAQAEPIASWAALGSPVYAAGWTAVEAKTDPVYNLAHGENTLVFEGFELPVANNVDMTLAIVLYMLDSMDEGGTPDYINFHRVSLVQNDFAIDCNSLSYDETIKRCQFYYETSYEPGTLAGTNTQVGARVSVQTQDYENNFAYMVFNAYEIVYNTIKRESSPTITFYNPAGTINKVDAVLMNDGAIDITSVVNSSDWTATGASQKSVVFIPNKAGNDYNHPSSRPSYYIHYHFISDARLGT